MEISTKAALAMLALALGCTPILAQGNPQDPPTEQQGVWDVSGPRSPMHPMRPGEELGRWGNMHAGFNRGDRMGMRGFSMGPRGFNLARLLKDPAIRQQIGVTAQQAATIRQQESDFRKTEIRDRADLEVKRIDLEDLLAADKPDGAAIDSKLQEISAARLALEKSAMHSRLTMRDAITPAQREKLRQLMSDRWRRGGGTAHHGTPEAGRRGQRGPAPAPNSQEHPQPSN